MEVYYFDPEKSSVEVFSCDKVVAGVSLCTAVNSTTNEQIQIDYMHLLYIVKD